jgi:uncharacterized membrane protein
VTGRAPIDREEGTPGIGRVEAFSDGVLAIIITIMVLELKAPEEPGLDHLWRLWPVFSSYALSFAYVGIYWVNHHRLFSHARRVTNALVWFNLLLLFALSLIPFSTAYLGNQHFSRDATLVYLATMLLPSLSYVPLQHVIRTTGAQSGGSRTYHRQTLRKGVAATGFYALGVPLTFVSPWLGIAAALIVALLWFLPRSPIDDWFDS